MKTIKTLAAILALVMLCSMLPAASLAETAQESVITVNCNDGDPGTLDPFQPASSARTVCLMQVYDRLLDYDDNGDLVGVLVKEWKQEGRVVTLSLYDTIYDTAGNHFTANDVVYCIQKEADGGNTSALIFDDMKVIDDYTVELTVNSDTVYTFENNVVGLYMLTQAAYEASGENMSMAPVSTAAYMVTEYETGATITMVKNDNYWQKDESLRLAQIQKQNVDTIVYNLMTESNQIIVGLESGSLDAAFCDFTLATRFGEGGQSANLGLMMKSIATWGGNAFYFNDSDKSFFNGNIDLKKAILYSIDREAIREVVFNGHCINPCCYGQIRYMDSNPAWEAQDYFNYNPELAAEYFAKSGVKAGELTLRLIYPNSSYCDNMADLVQAYLGVLGINVEINGLDAAIYSEYITDPTQWDIAFIGKGGNGTITRIWNATLNRNNYRKDGAFCAGFINDDTLQGLVETASNVNTNSVEACDAVQQYLIEKAYNMQLYVEEKCVVYNGNKIVDICTNVDARWVPGASTFVWNAK